MTTQEIISEKEKELRGLIRSMKLKSGEIKKTQESLSKMKKELGDIKEKYRELLEKTVHEIFIDKGLKWCGGSDHATTEGILYVYFTRSVRHGSEPFQTEGTRRYLYGTCSKCKHRFGKNVSLVEKRGKKLFFVEGGGELLQEHLVRYMEIPGIQDKDFQKVQEAIGITFLLNPLEDQG